MYGVASWGSGGDSTLLPVEKAMRFLGVASRIITFMVCLDESEEQAAGQQMNMSRVMSRTALALQRFH